MSGSASRRRSKPISSNATPEGDIAVISSFGPLAGRLSRARRRLPDRSFSTPISRPSRASAARCTRKGKLSGPLDYIRTSGKTRTEGFYLSSGGEKFPLSVDYDAVVDGTNGDTHLERVDGRLGAIAHHGARRHRPSRGDEGTPHHARHVHQRRPPRGLRRASRRASRWSPLTGVVNVKAKLDIPPGEGEVIGRMTLDGTFDVASAESAGRLKCGIASTS